MMFEIARKLNTKILDNQLLTEATYYGKNSKFQKAENAILGMKKAYSEKSPKKILINETEFHKHREDLENILADIFGFKNVYINRSIITNMMKIKSGKTMAFTLASSMLVTDSLNVLKGKYNANVDRIDELHNGTRFKKENEISIIINLDNYLFLNNELNELDFNEKEILAIILHEIGHNFYNNKSSILIMNLISIMFDVNNFAQFIVDRLTEMILLNMDTKLMDKSKNGEKNISDILDNFIYSIDKVFKHKFIDSLNMVIKFLTITASVILSPLALVSILLSVIIIFIGIISKISPYGIYIELRKDTELFSDSFATSFGYGEYLASALVKFNDYSSGDYAKIKYSSGNKNIFEIFESFEFIMLLPLMVSMEMFDEHPRNEARLKHIIRYLEDCSDSIDNPKLKKEYEENIANVKKYRSKLNSQMESSMKLSDKESLLFQKILDCRTVEKIEKVLYSTSYDNLDFDK